MPNAHILLVDDSPNILKALQRTFKLANYSISCAESAAEAMKILMDEEIDVIISDENMPGVSGTDLLKMTRDMYPDVIRMMLTGSNDVEIAKRAINEGAIWRFFTKPWDDFELLVAVRQAVQMSKMSKENKILKETVMEKDELLESLKKEHPDIAFKNMTADGAIIID